MKNIFHILYDGVETLDFAGPHDVFAMANFMNDQSTDLPFHQYTIANSLDPIKSAGGINITPDFAFDSNIPPIDIIVIPGSPEIKNISENDPIISWIRANYSTDIQIISICLGAFPLVVALGNELNGHTLTTHHGAVGQLSAKVNSLKIAANVVDGVRYSNTRNVCCSAGVSAGIDAAFYILSAKEGPELAIKTANVMEYNRTINWSLQ